ncbi:MULTISPECIES: MaoC family dehydratase [Hydrocarboniphaga]|jgi:acyl dehydratase|uniref:Dehydratase n=1 Tax=Hydrocarboniphaga effusa AP103 TaxID=1172194 RepID=I8T2A1_9GAMM|nr:MULTISPECIES: MaoC family dehydratase [Hydrocarboniphaga]EIT67808.1 dehydratase [Hydrocarboniphaga effusa AP103]MDZ4080516.1 MaoC family dehydratase [Hydrocarboniphaga sp.]
MPIVFDSAESLLAAVGQSLGVTPWLTIDQQRIDTFADATGDHQWIHVDPVRAAQSSFGSTIAHGFLTVSLCAFFLPQLIDVRMKMGVNVGSDRLRFPNAVKCGARIRAAGELVAAEATRDGGLQTTTRLTIEIENEARPACVVDLLSRYYF